MMICPVCNGLVDFIKYCPKCGEKMQVLDRIENYYDGYSPYLSYELTDLNDGDLHDVCSHVCVCNACNFRDIIKVLNVNE